MKATPQTKSVYGPFIATRQPMSRRHFLRGAGVAMSLPMLNAMLPNFARAQASSSPLAPNAKPRRMFAAMSNLGFLVDQFAPTGAGRDYAASPYTKLLEDNRNNFTVFTGVSLPSVSNSHSTEVCWITGAPGSGSGSFKNTISLDQMIAEKIGVQTRFPSLSLAVNGNTGLSYTRSGVAIPPEQSPSTVFKQLFVQGNQDEIEAQVRELEIGRSIMDTVTDQVKSLKRDVDATDRDRIDQYLTSVRDLENRLHVSQGWERKPKPVVQVTAPTDETNTARFVEKLKQMMDLTKLVFETDSSRAVTLFISCTGTPVVESPNLGVAITEGYHGLSHHGKSEVKLSQMRGLESAQLRLLNSFINGIKNIKEGDDTLLDRTMVLFGSNLSDGNSHVTKNLPIIFAGGGFKHGQHLVFDRERNYPLTNLHLSMLHRMGIETDKFSSSTGTMRGLEMT
jgi:hypothetical protein